MAEKVYIEREALEHCIREENHNLAGLIQHIREHCPTADVVEVRHAVKADSAISETGLMCTACYSDVDRDAVWCKYCGAKMEEIIND